MLEEKPRLSGSARGDGVMLEVEKDDDDDDDDDSMEEVEEDAMTVDEFTERGFCMAVCAFVMVL